MAAVTPEGEFRVPEDVAADDVALLTAEANGADEADGADDASDGGAPPPAPPPPVVDTTRTPGPVVGAVALGVVAAPLLGVYAVLFVTRYFLQPGVSPDVTSSWTGEGVAGLVAAVLAGAMLVIVARAAGGRGLPVFVGAQVAVVGACAYLLSDAASGGRPVTVVVGLLALAAIVLALVPVSRRWFAAHAAERAIA